MKNNNVFHLTIIRKDSFPSDKSSVRISIGNVGKMGYLVYRGNTQEAKELLRMISDAFMVAPTHAIIDERENKGN